MGGIDMTSAQMVKTMRINLSAVSGLSKPSQITRSLLAILLVVFSSTVFGVTMENIEFSSLPGDKTEIRMTFDGTPPSPTGYTIEQPARIALDLSGVASALAAKHHALGSGNARSVTVVESGDRTRVIVSMSELVAYSTRVLGNSLYVLVGEDDSSLVSSDQPQVFAA
ncbi:MAG TPA: AMIN domain-containing protein, partial [Gammaproteobacteria bacterium]|nr:AMIN domain-containing protein [Gammaproteobacteria bacterium]